MQVWWIVTPPRTVKASSLAGECRLSSVGEMVSVSTHCTPRKMVIFSLPG